MKNKLSYLAICTLLLSVLLYACKKSETSEEDIPTGDIPCIPAGLKNNTLAFYTFGNGSLKDASGNGHDLTNTTTASPGMDRSNNANCAYRFNAKSSTQEFLTTANTSFLNGLSQFSISLWYKPEDSSRKGGDCEVLINRDTISARLSDRNGQWSVSLYDCRRAVFARNTSVWDTLISSGSGQNLCSSEVSVRTGSWHHLVVTFNKSNNEEMKIYRDGALQETDSGLRFATATKDIGDLFIGQLYTGSIDDIIIFNKTLTLTEVNDLAAMGSCCDVD